MKSMSVLSVHQSSKTHKLKTKYPANFISTLFEQETKKPKKAKYYRAIKKQGRPTSNDDDGN